MTRRLWLLVGGSLALWLLLALPARWLGGGDHAVAYSGTALALCLGPALLTLLWLEFSRRGSPSQVLLATLGSTGVRLFFVAVMGFLLYSQVPFFREQPGFLIWLAVFYLLILGLEVALVLSAGPGKPA